jgi:hypothetical protein
MLRIAGGRPGLRRLLVSYFLAVSPRCQASRAAGVTGKTPAQRSRGISRVSAGEPHSVGGLVPYPPGVPAQHRVLVPERQQFSLLGQVPAEHQDGEGGYKANYQVDDLERHSASQPPPPPGHKRLRRSATQSSV